MNSVVKSEGETVEALAEDIREIPPGLGHGVMG